MPLCFINYPNCHATIDCNEILIHFSNCRIIDIDVFTSNSKSNFMIKFLIAISPSGLMVIKLNDK